MMHLGRKIRRVKVVRRKRLNNAVNVHNKGVFIDTIQNKAVEASNGLPKIIPTDVA